jgi:hypothetical protein
MKFPISDHVMPAQAGTQFFQSAVRFAGFPPARE